MVTNEIQNGTVVGIGDRIVRHGLAQRNADPFINRQRGLFLPRPLPRGYGVLMANVLDGSPDGRTRPVAIVVSRFNEIVTERLLDGARKTLRASGVKDEDVTVCWVPGAFELPAACRWLWATKRFDALVMLGAVVRGGTDHYEHVCNGVTEGAMQLGLDGLPLGFGVLTCSTMDQALARAGGEEGNKGSDAATAALAMANLRAQIGKLGSPG